MKILITGGCGFIGSHVVDALWKKHAITVIDKLTYAGKLNRIRGLVDSHLVKYYAADFSRPLSVGLRDELNDIEIIVHIGAETHVDNSIIDPITFVESNVGGTLQMLDYARGLPNLKQFIYFSTDEVFGSCGKPKYYWDAHFPSNPYAATKSAGEMMCHAYMHTHDMPITIVRCTNTFGERQEQEKYIPKIINSIMKKRPIIVHKHKSEEITRNYIYVWNVADAIRHIITSGLLGTMHITGGNELSNIELAQLIIEMMGEKAQIEEVDAEQHRPGIDLRYDLAGGISGWLPSVNFHDGLSQTINWYQAKRERLKA